jgi:hypothetical protein
VSGTDQGRRIGPSIGAFFAGLVAIFVLSNGTDQIFHSTGVFPPWGQPMSDGLFAFAFGYRFVFDTFGCWLTAKLAPRRPMKHALILGAFGLVLSAAAAAATWNKGPEFGPHWYSVILALSSLPSAWLGARIHAALAKSKE